MNPSDHLKRSLLRRAVLYAGHREGAERVLEAVVLAQPDLPRLADHQRDRLLIQRSREVGAWGAASSERIDLAGVALEGPAAQLWKGLSGLDRQQREAWMLIEVEQYDEIPAARAMDCSRTAMSRFHEAAGAVLTPLLGSDRDGAIEALRMALENVEVESSALAVDERLARILARRRLVTIVKFAILFAAMGIMAWVGYDLLRSDDGREPSREIQPKPPAELSPEEQELQELLRQQEADDAAGGEVKRP